MEEELRAYPLVMALMKRSRLRWRWIMVAVAALLLLLPVLLAYLDGVFTGLSHWNLWRSFLDGPVLIIYFLWVFPFLWRLWWRSVQALQSPLPEDEGNSNRLEVEILIPNRRREWASMIVGAVFWLSLWQPWGWGGRWEPGAIWLAAYDVVTQTILFSLVSFLVYSLFTATRHLNRLGSQYLNLDIFDTLTLAPIARSSLGFFFAIIGGISLSLVFQTQADLLMWNNITIWVIMICFAVLLFFMSMWSVHTAMDKAKNHELILIRQHLARASRELRERMSRSELNDVSQLSSTIAAWVSYERRIREAPSWPFSAGIIRRLAASVLVPGVVYLIKIMSGLGLRL